MKVPSRVVPLRAPSASEPLVSRRRVSEHFGVSERTIQRWQTDGMPHLARGRTVRYRLSDCEAWLEGGG